MKQKAKFTMKEEIFDCVIIGGGPAGLMAATYLTRYRCKIKLIDNCESRARLIPRSHNFPSYAQGITGEEILHAMREQVNQYSNCMLYDTTESITREEKTKFFTINNVKTKFYSKNIILATGVIDIEPKLANLTSAIKDGIVRHCIICDGFEIIDKKIALIANGRKAIDEVLFLNNYTKHISIFTLGKNLKLNHKENSFFFKNGINIIKEFIDTVAIKPDKSIVFTLANKTYQFDHIYSVLGIRARSDLAIAMGAHHLKDRRLITDKHQETNIPGLFAIGDVVTGLNQMSIGISQAARAATKIFRSKLQTEYKLS